MKRAVVFGMLGLVWSFEACDGEVTSYRRPKTHPTEGGAPGEGGEDQGGMAASGVTGGFAGSGPGGSGAGRGGASVGGRGLGGFGGAGGGGRGGGGSGGIPCGFYDCARLPNVRPGAPIECRDGVCVVTPDACQENFAHCSPNTNVGCEADLRTSEHCGACNVRCAGFTPACVIDEEGARCATGCEEPRPDYCEGRCLDLQTDIRHCGTCFVTCFDFHVDGDCVAGSCVPQGPCYSGWGDCDDEFGCETPLNSPDDCGVCGRDTCGATNAAPDCSSTGACLPPVCNVGYGNCDRTSSDCESSFGGTCFPRYLGTKRLAARSQAAAVADDGSFMVAGTFEYDLDFDTSAATDFHSAVGVADCYVTRFDASGNYAWTRTFGGANHDDMTAMSVAPDGSPIVAGRFYETIDLDPGAAEDLHTPGANGAVFLSKLTTAGSLSWARVINGNLAIRSVATDAAGAVYIAGTFETEVDLDPGVGTAVRTPPGSTSGFIVKLDAAGTFVWAATVDGSSPGPSFGVAVASDGSVWTAGKESGASTINGMPLGSEEGAFVAALEPSGALRRSWSFGPPTVFTYDARIAAGAVVVAHGTFVGSLDFDLGAGDATRFSEPDAATGYTLGLDTSGAYRSVHMWPGGVPIFIAVTPGGGSLVATGDGKLSAFYPDGGSSWSFAVGGMFFPDRLASSSTHFIVAGTEYGEGDFDPGPAMDRFDSASLVTRYAY